MGQLWWEYIVWRFRCKKFFQSLSVAVELWFGKLTIIYLRKTQWKSKCIYWINICFSCWTINIAKALLVGFVFYYNIYNFFNSLTHFSVEFWCNRTNSCSFRNVFSVECSPWVGWRFFIWTGTSIMGRKVHLLLHSLTYVSIICTSWWACYYWLDGALFLSSFRRRKCMHPIKIDALVYLKVVLVVWTYLCTVRELP